MNLLAHLHLSDGLSVAESAGNLLADYVRRVGTEPIDDAFRAGMRFHQDIDVFAERDADHQAARRCLGPAYRRLAGVIVDVAFDYDLSRHWARSAEVPLEQYVAERIAPIQTYVHKSKSPLGPLLDRAIEEGWLLSSSSLSGLQTTFRRVSGRSRAARGLLGAEKEIERQHACLEKAFLSFYPRLMETFRTGETDGSGGIVSHSPTAPATGAPRPGCACIPSP